jgi:microsomal dipeptidase-like Zn-dependent dipeptidase
MVNRQPDASPIPVFDLHCDLLSYMDKDFASLDNTGDIGCALPYLRSGNVKLQVLAVYVPTEPHSAEMATREFERFARLPEESGDAFFHVDTVNTATAAMEANGIGIVAAIENASALCTDDEPLDPAFERLEKLVARAGKVLYITMTHHAANRFGGGNMTDIGLKDDGKTLLEYLSGKRIAIDFSHTSDSLAREILDHIDSGALDIPILASHSNFRSVFEHARNLPDWLASEIVQRGGVIGMNFVRAFVHDDDPSYLERHIAFGFDKGYGEAICFGADYFYWKNTLDQGRLPFYHPEHENAGKYQEVLRSLGPDFGTDEKKALAHGNALRFLNRLWG